MASKKSKKAHVTFGDSKRILSYEKGEDVQDLRHIFLREFSDVLSDDVAPANIKFQRYDESFKDYVDLGNGIKLEENAKIKAITVSTHGKKVHDCSKEITEVDDCSHVHPHVKFVIPMYRIEDCSATAPDIKLHLIKRDVPYRFWCPVSNGLIATNLTNPQNGQTVTCSGAFTSANTVVQAKSVGINLFQLVFNGGGPQDDYLYMTAQGEGQSIIATSTSTDDSVFEPAYYWGHTMFRSKPWSTLYLGADRDGKAMLVPMTDPLYPNPQALFVVNEYQ